MRKEAVAIGSRREVLWDSFMIEEEKSSAQMRVHPPIKRECVMHLDKPWEGDACSYYNILTDEDENGPIYRMYYFASMLIIKDDKLDLTSSTICYAESRDGFTWVRPKLGICEYNGSKDNNIILDKTVDWYDNFFVFKDTNPNAKPDEKYKAVAECCNDITLWGYTSADAVHWKRVKELTRKARFDTLNTCFYREEENKYYCFVRNMHNNEEKNETDIRDVRVLTSDNFWDWSEPTMLKFDDAYDYPLYTNNISPYYRATHMLTGFPTRYVQRNEWCKNFDRLTGLQARKTRAAIEQRNGTAITDCIFMSSRDGYNWKRFNEAWLTPGIEHQTNWVYGDCYPSVGMIETPTEYGDDAPKELSMYCYEGQWTFKPSRLYRYTMRIDGFASYYAPYEEKTLVTRPFTFNGDTLKLNFSTSARGIIRVKVLDEDYNEIPGLYTTDIFGDRIDSPVDFEEGDLSSVKGRTIRLQFILSDADLYSFVFE